MLSQFILGNANCVSNYPFNFNGEKVKSPAKPIDYSPKLLSPSDLEFKNQMGISKFTLYNGTSITPKKETSEPKIIKEQLNLKVAFDTEQIDAYEQILNKRRKDWNKVSINNGVSLMNHKKINRHGVNFKKSHLQKPFKTKK